MALNLATNLELGCWCEWRIYHQLAHGLLLNPRLK